MVDAMLRPDLFGGLATHAGDALFEVCYLPDFRTSVRALRDHYDGSFEQLLGGLPQPAGLLEGDDGVLLNDWCMAACYSADEDGTVHLPYDTATGELIHDVWARWLAWDPVRMVPAHADALRAMRAICIDAGRGTSRPRPRRGGLPPGARADRRHRRRLRALRRHALGIEYRYPLSLKYLAERLSP